MRAIHVIIAHPFLPNAAIVRTMVFDIPARLAACVLESVLKFVFALQIVIFMCSIFPATLFSILNVRVGIKGLSTNSTGDLVFMFC